MANLNENMVGLQQILETVNALPDAGSEGEGSVETCTVKIYGDSFGATRAMPICYQTLENGEVVTKVIAGQPTFSITVLCGSTFVFIASINTAGLYSFPDGIDVVYNDIVDSGMANFVVCHANLAAGETGTIVFDSPYE